MSELDKLEAYLKEHGYTYTRKRRFEMAETAQYTPELFEVDGGEQIIVYDNEGERSFDAICGYGSYGYEHGLLEIMGNIVWRDIDGDSVAGWLTAADVIDRIEGRVRR